MAFVEVDYGGGGGESDYTELYSGTNTSPSGANITLSQSMSNFKTLCFIVNANGKATFFIPVSEFKQITGSDAFRFPCWTSSERFDLSINSNYVNDTTIRIWGGTYSFKVLGK